MPWAEALIRSQTSELPPFDEGGAEDGARIVTYSDALNEAMRIAMELDPKVFLIGEGNPDPHGMFGVSKGLHEQFGEDRNMESPLSEEGIMGICTGAAMNGLRPVFMHNRPDFLLLAFNQIVNHASKVHFLDNGENRCPMVVWSAIGRGWGSGSQHSQAIQGLLMSVPGIKIVLPSTPHDSKGLMLSAIADNNPVFIFEHRWMMRRKGHVPEGMYHVPIGKGAYRTRGKDVTIVGTSHALQLAMDAASKLKAEKGIEAEVIDLRTVKPLDEEIIFESLEKTGRLLVVDTGWAMGGVCAEIGCLVAEKAFHHLKAPIARVGLPDGHCPAGAFLEKAYYPDEDTMAQAIEGLMKA